MSYIRRYRKIVYSFIGIAVILLAIIILQFQFQLPIRDVSAYNKWLNKEKNGCITSHDISGMHITVKYQPPTYLVMKQLAQAYGKEGNVTTRDSLLKIQNKLMTFLLTITPNYKDGKAEAKSLMYNGINSYAEYEQRVLDANFFMGRYIKLYIDGVAFVPILSVLDNVYELSKGRSFMVVFAPSPHRSITKGKDYLFVYNDPFFSMGKVQFDFSGTALAKARAADVVWQ